MALITVGLLVFVMFQLTVVTDADRTWYYAIISSILTFWAKPPAFKKRSPAKDPNKQEV